MLSVFSASLAWMPRLFLSVTKVLDRSSTLARVAVAAFASTGAKRASSSDDVMPEATSACSPCPMSAARWL